MLGAVAIAGFYHETNTFSVTPTTFQDFEDYQFAVGSELLDRYEGTGTELGGMILAAKDRGIDLAPLLFAAAVLSGTIRRGCLDRILGMLMRALRDADPVAGLLLVLHGAAVAEGVEDVDGHLLARFRDALGTDCPIVVTTDYHANLSPRMVASSDVIVGYDSYPHVDMADRGAEAVSLLVRLRNGGPLATAFRKLPLATVPQRQPTAEEPVAPIIARLHELEKNPEIACGTLAMGFPYADTGDLGASVLVYGESDDAVNAAADEIAGLLWSRRKDFLPDLTQVEDLAGAIGPEAEVPLILADPADNVGGGSPGDGTVVLRELLRIDARGAVVVINDPAAVSEAAGVGIGGRFSGLVGAKVDGAHGEPVHIEGPVAYLGEARFRHSGSYMTGFVTTMGLTAVVAAGGVQVVITSLRTMPFDIEQLRAVGIEPAEQRVIVVKSAIAWRAAYGPLAASTLTLDTPGICPSNLARLAYRNRPRPLYPLETDGSFPGV